MQRQHLRTSGDVLQSCRSLRREPQRRLDRPGESRSGPPIEPHCRLHATAKVHPRRHPAPQPRHPGPRSRSRPRGRRQPGPPRRVQPRLRRRPRTGGHEEWRVRRQYRLHLRGRLRALPRRRGHPGGSRERRQRGRRGGLEQARCERGDRLSPGPVGGAGHVDRVHRTRFISHDQGPAGASRAHPHRRTPLRRGSRLKPHQR